MKPSAFFFKVLHGGTPRERVIAAVTAVVLVFSMAFAVLMRPRIDRQEQTAHGIAVSERKLKTYRALLENQERLRADFNRVFSSVPTVSAAKESSLVTALSELEQLAHDAGIRIVDIRPQGFLKETALYKEAVIDVRGEGTIEGFSKFIYNIETSVSLLRIRKFQLTVKPNSDVLSGTFSLSLVATAE